VAALVGGWLAERLRAKGIDASSTSLRGGVVTCADRDTDASMALFIDAVTAALQSPINEDDLGKLRAMRSRAVDATPELAAAQCQASVGGAFNWTAATLDDAKGRMRSRSRVAFGVVGAASSTQAALGAVERGPAWTDTGAAAAVATPAPASVLLAQAREVPPGRLWLNVTIDTSRPLGAVGGALRAGREGVRRARAQDPRLSVESVAGVSRGEGGCAHVTVSVASSESDLSQALGGAAALLEAELSQGAVSHAPLAAPAPVGSAKDAARHVAWWALAKDASGPQPSPRVTVAFAPSKATPPVDVESVETAWRRAKSTLDKQRIELRSKVEAGQSELWAVLGSPCGTGPEALADAGSGALAASSFPDDSDVELRPLVDSEGIGLVAHGLPRPGETPLAHATRMGDALGRAFAGMAESPAAADRIIAARLAGAGGDDDLLAFARLASAVAPAHPSWLLPLGPADANARMTARTLASRAAGLRQGPVRLAVLATESEAQAQDLARAAERWVFPREGSASCTTPQANAPTAGMFTLQRRAPGPSVIYLGVPLPALDEGSHASARTLAAFMDADDGPLRVALRGSARDFGVKLAGRKERAAIVVRVVTAPEGVDAAADRLRAAVTQLGATPLDAGRIGSAAQRVAQDALQRQRSPEQRATDLFLGRSARTPSTESVQTLATQVLQADRLVLSVLRPQAGK
jgi:hypothetical protein